MHKAALGLGVSRFLVAKLFLIKVSAQSAQRKVCTAVRSRYTNVNSQLQAEIYRKGNALLHVDKSWCQGVAGVRIR